MKAGRPSALFDLADLVLAVSRQLTAQESVDSDDHLTPVEATVLRHVDRNPGTSAGAAAEATMLRPSNFSRALRNLEAKEYVRREADPRDARAVRLFPTSRAAANLERLDLIWSETLDGILDDATRDLVIVALERLEAELARRRGM